MARVGPKARSSNDGTFMCLLFVFFISLWHTGSSIKYASLLQSPPCIRSKEMSELRFRETRRTLRWTDGESFGKVNTLERTVAEQIRNKASLQNGFLKNDHRGETELRQQLATTARIGKLWFLH
ncbi:hypothetical protein HPB48_004327 [Haemaphysalis longicornis]|uniref:Uncharacterized protein n=1 Tax=Haemaphysalis longicornis TaxID=44386 RepID=A0A9J6G392_HAELO|nr:hypothetical protein HPB48_004327 [Haemaphysalis longicornis]